MNPKETPELTVKALMTLRQESDALRIITERLKVKEMGPADHIRTKHEVKAFVESGDETAATRLMKLAAERRLAQETLSVKQTQQRGERMGT
jgi:hypothetical protein